MFGLGIWEVVIIVVVALMVLGPERLPKVARQLGRVTRELRRAAADFQRNLTMEANEMDRRESETVKQFSKPSSSKPDQNAPPPEPASQQAVASAQESAQGSEDERTRD